MKKILLLGVSLLISFNVSAKENNIYYSNYSDWSDFSLSEINISELRDVKIERRFRWYKNKEHGEFLKLDEGVNKYINVDKNNYKYSDYSEWSLEKVEATNNVIVETEKRYLVKKIKPINNILILSGSFNSEHVDLNSIEIYNNGVKVGIKPTWTGNYIIDKDEGAVELKLDNYYYLDDLTIIIKPTNISDINTMYLLASAPINDDEAYFYYWMMYENNGDDSIVLNVNNFSKFAPQYDEQIYDYIPDLKYSDEIEELMYYRYKNKLYYFYNYEKEYVEGYFSEFSGYEKDESQYVDYYSYRDRDKIEIGDYIEITDKNQKLDDYITSNVEYSIDGTVNYDKNGIYHVKVKNYFLEKMIPVIVNILENYALEKNSTSNNEISKSDTENTINKTDNSELLQEYDKLKKEYENMLIKSKENNNYNNNNDLECTQQLEEISLKNNDNEKKLKLSNQAYDYLKSSLLKIDNDEFNFGLSWYLWLFLLIILLIIIIILILKNKKDKNKF